MTSFILRASAKPFTPNAIFHKILKRVHWHPTGIIGVRRFIIEACDALPVRELKYVPISIISKANPEESTPFHIPPPSPTFNHILTIHEQRPTIKQPLVRQNAVKDDFWINWCE